MRAAGGGQVQSTLDLREPGLRLATIKTFVRLLKDDLLSKREDFEVLGQHLQEALFTPQVHAFYSERLAKAKKANKRLRVQLEFTGDVKELINLPWEYLYLYDPEGGEFLATRADLILSRFLPMSIDRESLAPSDDTLRILVAVSRTVDLDEPMAKDTLEAIRGLVRDSGADDDQTPIEVRELPDEHHIASRQDLELVLGEQRPHVLHFIGHGAYEETDGQAQIGLMPEDEDQPTDWCTSKELIDLFREAKWFPRLIVLHMCEGGAADKDPQALVPYTGFGPRLINARIPAVVAMQFPITNFDAMSFAVAFYHALADGSSVDEAVQRGRRALGKPTGWSKRVFGSPVLYMHSSDGIINPQPVPPRANKTKLTAGAADAAASVVTSEPAEAPEDTYRDAAPKLTHDDDFLGRLVHIGYTAGSDDLPPEDCGALMTFLGDLRKALDKYDRGRLKTHLMDLCGGDVKGPERVALEAMLKEVL